MSYASDLARRLRERDFTVFFSEDEAAPGYELTATLRNALYRSKALVVIANRETMREPRWVRTEVEEFSARHPDWPLILISVAGALQDAALAAGGSRVLVSGSADRTAKLWDASTDPSALVLNKPEDRRLFAVAVSADGPRSSQAAKEGILAQQVM